MAKPYKGRDVGRFRPFCAPCAAGRTSGLEGFENEGLIRLNNSAQRSRLVVGRRAQKPMPPAEGGVGWTPHSFAVFARLMPSIIAWA